MVEDAHCEGRLGEVPVTEEAVGLESSVLGRTHTREVDAVPGAPVVLLEVAQVVCEHGDVGAPLFLQTYEHTHTYGVHAGLSHTVEGIAAPFEIGLHPARVVYVVVRAIIGLLEAYYPVHAVVGEAFVLLSLQRLHLDLEVGKIFLGPVQSLRKVVHTCLCRVLARHYKQVLEGSEFLYCLIFVFALLRAEYDPGHRVGSMEAAIYAMIYARIGYI